VALQQRYSIWPWTRVKRELSAYCRGFPDELAPLAPAPVAPHPLLGGLADPGLELALHRGRDPLHIVGLVGRARHLELLQLDPEAALLAHAQAARHPDACAEASGDHGRD